ncbi:MAG: hypothetical protein EBS01_09070, partial [Verrucomicrobia bacterium]|nr:hypothetical protein [Verrucomicrobiota bacterium]
MAFRSQRAEVRGPNRTQAWHPRSGRGSRALGCPLGCIAALSFVFTGVCNAADSDQGRESPAYGPLSVFAKVLQLVRQDYVDESKVAFPSLIGG